MANVLVPISVGELVDKITILRIKQRKITDSAKLINIVAELDALKAVAKEHNIGLDAAEVADLESVNMRLWDIEDDIRQEERDKNFGERFVELARAVYVTNDQRFEAKSKVNDLFGSELREEKSYESYQ